MRDYQEYTTQVDHHQANGNGYDHLEGDYLAYYKVASKFSHKAKAEDTEDLLHDIMLTLALAERNNGHKPFTEAVMYRIASRISSMMHWRQESLRVESWPLEYRLSSRKKGKWS